MTPHVHKSLAEMTTEVIVAFLNNNQIEISELPDLIRNTHQSMKETVGSERYVEPVKLVDHTQQEALPPRGNGLALEKVDAHRRRPAVPIPESVTDDYVFCLECGKRFKTMRHHLQLFHDMTPEEYRTEWRLPPDWPITAPNHSDYRRRIAKSAGLGSRITSK